MPPDPEEAKAAAAIRDRVLEELSDDRELEFEMRLILRGEGATAALEVTIAADGNFDAGLVIDVDGPGEPALLEGGALIERPVEELVTGLRRLLALAKASGIPS